MWCECLSFYNRKAADLCSKFAEVCAVRRYFSFSIVKQKSLIPILFYNSLNLAEVKIRGLKEQASRFLAVQIANLWSLNS